GQDGGEVTAAGASFLCDLGADLTTRRSRRIFCRPCLDWSERRYHVAGLVGAEICRCCLERRWLRSERDERAVKITPAGRTGFAETLGLELSEGGEPHVAVPILSASA